jgi:hypothetical protein
MQYLLKYGFGCTMQYLLLVAGVVDGLGFNLLVVGSVGYKGRYMSIWGKDP